MPLVVPGLQNSASASSQNNAEEWMNRLAGKTLGDKSDETTFARSELPKSHRVVKQGQDFSQTDHDAERINIVTDDNGVVMKVTSG
ncbi:hypothetical protein K470DRAFT_242595 [Piedraia hortae CBS 480.64]|uniref:Uncharacterized protein n=1 Tax=Piedraia hortae CBS 480.64 TaxID=1314780 RepID=A0A6A7C7R3_9PEZI|nr:hypothetical protein K470DRAFT_242595 [Piedraia hortae CBS 480.64]